MWGERILGNDYRPDNLDGTQLRGLDLLWGRIMPLTLVVSALNRVSSDAPVLVLLRFFLSLLLLAGCWVFLKLYVRVRPGRTLSGDTKRS